MTNKRIGDINIFRQRARHFNTVGLLVLSSMIGLLALGLGVFSNSVFAESSANGSTTATSRVAVTLKEIIALRILDKTASSEISNLVLDITPTPNGVFTKGSFIAETSTSNATGYKLYLTSIGKDHLDTYTNSLINIDSSVEPSVGTIPSLTSGASVTEAAFRVNNSAYKNKWGYSTNGLIVNTTTNNGATTIDSIADNTNTSEITYADIPENAESRQIDNKSAAIDKGITPITIGVNASSAVTSGVYKNTLELTAIANPLSVDYSLSFDGNSTGTVTGLPTTMEASSVASSYTFTIPSNVPTTSGYTFKEWNTTADGSGDSYSPGDDFTVSADDIAGTDQVLYAIWMPVPAFFTITYMQDMTSEICNSATTPDVTVLGDETRADTDGSHNGDTNYVPETTLIDYRGINGTGTASSPATGTNQVSYKVRKLADGNCWMTQNLKLTLSTSTTLEVGTFTGGTTSWTPNSTTEAYVYNYAITPSTKADLSVNTDIDAKNGGNAWYYPWYAATAGQGTQTTSPNITQSICPKGWRLPLGTTADKSFYNLFTTKYGLESSAAGSTSLQSFPLDFTLSGYVDNGSQLGAGSYGYYWSASPDTSRPGSAYNLYFRSDIIASQNYYSAKYYGRSVRCVSV